MMINLNDQDQATYTATPAPVDINEVIITYKALLSGDNLPVRVAVQTVDLRALISHIDEKNKAAKWGVANLKFFEDGRTTLTADPFEITDPCHTNPFADDSTLWCVNIHGPDDIVAAPDYVTAVRMANVFNAWWLEQKIKIPITKYDPRMWAVPIEYPHSDGHADNLANTTDDYQGLRAAALSPAEPTKCPTCDKSHTDHLSEASNMAPPTEPAQGAPQ